MRLIDADALSRNGWSLIRTGVANTVLTSMSIADVPTVEALRWIPVEDETPPAGEVVFVSMGNMLAAGWYLDQDEWFNILSKKVENVAWTHWMHIPDGPEETSYDK